MELLSENNITIIIGVMHSHFIDLGLIEFQLDPVCLLQIILEPLIGLPCVILRIIRRSDGWNVLRKMTSISEEWLLPVFAADPGVNRYLDIPLR